MFNVCPNCGLYNAAKIIDPSGPFAVCPNCGYKHLFVQLPLFVLTGASGAGKSTLCIKLAQKMNECVVLESDILWRSEFNHPEDNYQDYRDMWLRLAKNIHQSGRPVILCGTATPDGFERSVERRYFTRIHYLALVCDDEILEKRLKSRPAWREAGDPIWIGEMVSFNNWIKLNAPKTHPPITLLDTTNHTPSVSTEVVIEWVRKEL